MVIDVFYTYLFISLPFAFVLWQIQKKKAEKWITSIVHGSQFSDGGGGCPLAAIWHIPSGQTSELLGH
jgi:hypothetical protein